MAIICGLMTVIHLFQVYQGVDALLYRAQVSVEADKLAVRLGELSKNMERFGMTHGYVFPLIGSPRSDVGLDYEAINDAHDRAIILSGLEKSSAAYQSGMDDLRGVIRELQIDGMTFVAWRYLPIYAALLLLLILFVRLSSLM